MISYIKGQVVKKGIDYLLLENNDIGYHISTSLSTLNKVSEKERVVILTYMHIREDIMALYGFYTSQELDLFKKLITVNRIGPKVGLSILSTYEAPRVKEIILKEDVVSMSKVPGIGRKTASKIFLDLKDKLGSVEDLQGDSGLVINNELSAVVDALTSLGFTSAEVKETLDGIDLKGKAENDIIKEALKNMNRQG